MTQPRHNAAGVALLEVVAAIAIFFVTGLFVLDGLTSSLRAVREAQLKADAADLGCSVMSAIHIGLAEIRNEGPVEYDPISYPGWTLQVVVTEPMGFAEYPLLRQVEVIVRNESEGFTHRLLEFVTDDEAEETGGTP